MKKLFKAFKERFKAFKEHLKGLNPKMWQCYAMVAFMLFIAVSPSCRSPTANAQGNLANFTLSKPDIQITHAIFVSNPQNKTFQVNISFDYLGNVYYHVGGLKYQIGDIDNHSFPNVNVSCSSYGIGDFASLSIHVSALHTIDSDLWLEGITDFEYNTTIESTGYGGVHYQFNDAYDLTILFDFNLSTTASVKLVAEPTICYLYNDLVYDKIYNYGSQVGFDEGKAVGFDEGYLKGVNENPNTLSPLRLLTNMVDDLLNIEIWGDISLGSILRIGFAIILLGFVIKVFLGG